MLKDYQRSNEVVFAEEAIWISEHSSIENMASATVIAETFEKAEHPGNLLIPKRSNGRYFLPFARMLGAVWTGGYVAGIREKKAKSRRGIEFVPEEITAQKSADRWRKKRLAALLSKMDDTSKDAALALLKTMVSGGSNEDAVAACNAILSAAGRDPIAEVYE